MTRIAVLLALACVFVSAASAAATARVGEVGVSLALPAGWHSLVPSTTVKPVYTDPLTRVVAVSAPFTFGTGGCQIDYAFPSTAVAVTILEWLPKAPGSLPPPTGLPARPSTFDAKTLPLRSHSAECFSGPAGAIEFTDHGRTFTASIQAGSKASPAAIARARAVLESLRVQKL